MRLLAMGCALLALGLGCRSGMRVPTPPRTDGPGSRDLPSPSNDAGPDGNETKSETLSRDLAREVVPDAADVSDSFKESGPDQPELVPCTGTIVLGPWWPLAGTGALPTSVAVADLNGDGKLDLAIASYADQEKGPGSVSVILGKGDGAFAAKVDYSAGTSPYALAVADVNGDNKPDLITANFGSDTASVILGHGDGTFAAAVDYPTGKSPAAIAVADLNGDGNPDLVATSSASGTVGVLFGDGGGSFSAHVDYATGKSPYGVAIGDVNGDGKLDLVTANFGEGTVSVLLGIGGGTFAGKVDYAVGPTSTGPATVALADLDGDGRLDLVAAGKAPAAVSVFLGKGDGSFATRSDYRFGANFSLEEFAVYGDHATWLLVGDVNRDGKLDLVLADFHGVVVVLGGKGDGTFADGVTYPAGSQAISLALGDLNGDGIPDLAVADYSLSAVNLLFGNGDGGFPRPSSPSYAADSVALGDLNGDGRLDLVASANYDVAVHVLLADDAGGFAAPVDYKLGYLPTSLVVVDLNGDGREDIVASSWSWGSPGVGVLLGKGDGTFADGLGYAPGQDATESVAVGDLNGDGRLDLVTANNTENNAVSVLLASVDGKFPSQQSYPTLSAAFSVALADLNGDGKLDLAIPDNLGDVVKVMLGNGDGSFAPAQSYATGRGPKPVLAVDLNSDGKLDLVTGNANTDTVSVFLATAGGAFSAKVDYATGDGPISVAAGDMNGDGKVDVITANGSMVTVLLGKGDGTLGTRLDYAAQGSPVALGDLNRDGRLDVVAGSSVMLSACR